MATDLGGGGAASRPGDGTPMVKAENTRAHGARVILHGETLSESEDHARALCNRTVTKVAWLMVPIR